jgi:glycosyltransferase involved in cell wall biosynthesis
MGFHPIEIGRMVLAQLRLRRQLLDRRTIVQLHRPFRHIIWAGHRGPLVQFVHLDLREWPGPSGWTRFGHLYEPFSSGYVKSMARIFVVNQSVVEMLRRRHPGAAQRIELLPVWYDPLVFHLPTDDERATLRAQLASRNGWDESSPIVLFAGRLDANKDFGLALSAVEELVSSGVDVNLIVAGEGPERESAEQSAAARGLGGRVQFAGDVPRKEVARLMRAADALLLTSHSEGSPRVVVEGMASGLPIVAPDLATLQRRVTHLETGWLAANREPAALAEGIAWAIARPRNEIGAATSSAVAEFTAEKVLGRLYAFYRELAAAQPAPNRST